MSISDNFLANWHYHLPNLIMAAMIYTLIGRYVLELVFSKRPDVVILKVFRQMTDPILRVVRLVTPAVVPNGMVVVLSIVWLMGLRMFWLLTVLAAGTKLIATP